MIAHHGSTDCYEQANGAVEPHNVLRFTCSERGGRSRRVQTTVSPCPQTSLLPISPTGHLFFHLNVISYDTS